MIAMEEPARITGPRETVTAVLSAAFSVGVVVIIAALLRLSDRDVRFCRGVLHDLVMGRQSVQSRIDWERVTAMGVDIGATYAQLPNDGERAQYRRAFIRNFADGFRKSGGRLDGFTHWMVAPDGTVSADYPAKGKTLVFHLSAGGHRQLEGIGWRSP